MSIFIVRGPQTCGSVLLAAAPLPAPVMKSLVRRALDAGTSVALRDCRSEQELLDTLCAADHSPGEVTLLDPGACVDSPRLQRLLPRLHNVYVEIHADDGRAPQPCLPEGSGQRLGVAHGYRAQSYVLALELALDHLCRSEVGNRVHVGT